MPAQTLQVGNTDDLTAAINALSAGDGGTILLDPSQEAYSINAYYLGSNGLILKISLQFNRLTYSNPRTSPLRI